jgi:hypothetical protein
MSLRPLVYGGEETSVDLVLVPRDTRLYSVLWGVLRLLLLSTVGPDGDQDFDAFILSGPTLVGAFLCGSLCLTCNEVVSSSGV